MRIRQSLQPDPEEGVTIEDQHRLFNRQSTGLTDRSAGAERYIFERHSIAAIAEIPTGKSHQKVTFKAQGKNKSFNTRLRK